MRREKSPKADIARTRIEEALRVSEEKFRTLTENIPVGIFRSTPGARGTFLEVNRALVRMLRYTSKKALLAKDPAEMYQNPKERLAYSRKISMNGFVKNEELQLRKKDGTPIIVSETTKAVKDPRGKVLYFDGIIEDVTKRKRAEEEILLQKSYFERLFNSAPEAIALHDNDDIIVNVNDEFTRLFGYSRTEAVGRPINEVVPPTELRHEASTLSEKVIHGERVEVDSKRKRKDGRLIDVSILGAPIIHGARQMGVYAIYRDTTERKKAEEARMRSKEEARMARHIQMNLLPKFNPDIPGYDIGGKNLPALNVGGDYYDFIWMDDYRLAIALGDVSGKGLAASLVMANLQATVRGQALFVTDPRECLERANKLLFRSTDSRTFVSLFYGILDLRTHTLCYANAGQDMPILFPAGARPIPLKTRGIALGMKEDVSYEKEEIPINPGDQLLVYSDGVSEAMNERMEEFGEEGLSQIVQSTSDASAAESIEEIIAAVNSHIGNATRGDDMTLVLVRRNAG